jgi:stathmin
MESYVEFVSATEIRCQEESRGGLRYEVILAEPVTDTPPKPRPVSPTSKTADIESITEKMLAAEERRKVCVHLLFASHEC